MKKMLLVSTLFLAALATPALAEDDCSMMLAKVDAVLEIPADEGVAIPQFTEEEITVIVGLRELALGASDEDKAKILDMREQAKNHQAVGDEDACVTVLTSAFEVLEG